MNPEKTADSELNDGVGAKVSKKSLAWMRGSQLQRELEHVNHEIYRRNLELAQTNKTLALLQAIDSLVLDGDRKSTRLNSSHSQISYAVFCLKKKKSNHNI